MDTLSKIFNLIDENNIKQKDFAVAIGVAPTTISEWRTGKSNSYLKYIYQISNYFNVSMDYFLATDEPENLVPEENKEQLNILNEMIRNFLLTKGALKPGEPLSEELKNTCVDVMFQLLESNYDQYKDYFNKSSCKS